MAWLLDAADLVITVGYDPVEYWPPLWNATSNRKIVHIDVLPADLDNSYQPYVELLGDIAATLQALTPQIQRSGCAALSSAILDHIKAERDQLAAESASRGGISDPSFAAGP
jgi:acetolactate synthase-1/2/3 large subunit